MPAPGDTLPTQPASPTSQRLIVEFKSPPLADWAKSAPALHQEYGKIKFGAPDTKRYLARLEAEQALFISALQTALPGAKLSRYTNEKGFSLPLSYQVVFNGLAVEPGQIDLDQARQRLMALPGVKLVYPDNLHQPDLYASIPLINAQAAYSHPAIGALANAGQGVKIASMDGGVHHAAPMFDGNGYSYPPDFPPGVWG